MQQRLNIAPILLKHEKEAGQGVRPEAQGPVDPDHTHQAPIRATNVASMDASEVMGCIMPRICESHHFNHFWSFGLNRSISPQNKSIS